MLVAALSLIGGPPPVPPGQVTDLRVTAITDTSVVLTWTEISSGTSGIARYVVRYAQQAPFIWGQNADVVKGGCGFPVYGSTAAGGRTRSCVLGGLSPKNWYRFQLAAYTGTLNTSTAVFGPLSNIVEAVTAERIGPMVVIRPEMMADSFPIRGAWIDAYPDTFPLRGWFSYGSYKILGFVGDSVVARGYLLVTKP